MVIKIVIKMAIKIVITMVLTWSLWQPLRRRASPYCATRSGARPVAVATRLLMTVISFNLYALIIGWQAFRLFIVTLCNGYGCDSMLAYIRYFGVHSN